MAPMVGLVAAAKGLAVGVLTLCISVAGAFAYLNWRVSACPLEEMAIGRHPSCDQELAGLSGLFEVVVVLFVLLLALGPLLAWGLLLPRPALYLIAPFLAI